MSRIDIVTVFHNETNRSQARSLVADVQRHEPQGDIRLLLVDNRIRNRGFAAGCNAGAFHPSARSPIIGFLNPDVEIGGPFIDQVAATLTGPVAITGCRFDKPQAELDQWGVHDWVCGATFFVTRTWFTSVRGFDPRFVWSHEETDLIRQAQTHGLVAKSIKLPLGHRSPNVDTPQDETYKRRHFAEAQQLYLRKWGS
jgi:GT2 family glycosyltransferase